MIRFLGYDPGGDDAHGAATLEVSAQGAVLAASTQLVNTGDDARAYFATLLAQGETVGLGVDTLTEWSLGSAGWRPADTWLRQTYPAVRNSVVSPNSIFGSMCLNGMGVVHALRTAHPNLVVSETHPKVLYFALTQTGYDWASSAAQMHKWLLAQLGTTCPVGTEHEFDALLSAWACMQGVLGRWTRDLHAAPTTSTTIKPAGQTKYFWP